MTIEEKKNLAVNMANTLMNGKIGNKEYLIEEYMDLYYEIINSDEKTVSKEEAYYLATNISNTFMEGTMGSKEDLIEEYMELYEKAINYNNFSFDPNELNEVSIRYLATNIANTFMKEKIGDKEDLVEEYMEFYNKAIEYNNKKIKEKANYFNIPAEEDLITKEVNSSYFSAPSEDELITKGRGR